MAPPDMENTLEVRVYEGFYPTQNMHIMNTHMGIVSFSSQNCSDHSSNQTSDSNWEHQMWINDKTHFITLPSNLETNLSLIMSWLDNVVVTSRMFCCANDINYIN
jgi:hypothetical protein